MVIEGAQQGSELGVGSAATLDAQVGEQAGGQRVGVFGVEAREGQLGRFAARVQACVAEGGVAAGQQDTCAQLGQVEEGLPELGACGGVQGSFPSWENAFQVVGNDQNT